MLLTALPRPLHTFKLLTLAILFAILPSHADPVAPDAGQTLRELQQLPDVNIPPPGPQLQIDQELHIDENIPETGTDNMAVVTRIMVKAFHISGNSKIPTSELEVLITDLAGNEHDLDELKAATDRITAYYRSRGYAVARAYLPAQDIIDGVVNINVIEGHIAKLRIDNQSRLSDKSAGGFLDQAKEGDVIRTAQIDRALLLLNDTPGVGSTRATLQPGASVGTSDLLMELKPGTAYSGIIGLDNYGNRYTGAYRLGGTLNLNSPFKIGDQISLGALASDQHLAYGSVAYQLPIGSSGLRLGAAYSYTRYRLGKEFTDLEAHGNASSSSAFMTYPFIRGQTTNLNGLLAWEQKKFTDHVDATSTITDKGSRAAKLGIAGNHRDSFGYSSMDIQLALGNLDIQSPDALAADAIAQTNGEYKKLNYTASRLQRLTASNQLSFLLYGQQASKNLDSSEKFSLGGAYGVRAYPLGEGIGDQGYLINLELRHNVGDHLQGTLFYDTGSITINHDPYGTTNAPNSQRLSGAGIGANADLAGTQIRISVAWRTDGGQPTTIPASDVHSTTLWLQASEQF